MSNRIRSSQQLRPPVVQRFQHIPFPTMHGSPKLPGTPGSAGAATPEDCRSHGANLLCPHPQTSIFQSDGWSQQAAKRTAFQGGKDWQTMVAPKLQTKTRAMTERCPSNSRMIGMALQPVRPHRKSLSASTCAWQSFFLITTQPITPHKEGTSAWGARTKTRMCSTFVTTVSDPPVGNPSLPSHRSNKKKQCSV